MMNKVSSIQKMSALLQRILPRFVDGAGLRASSQGQERREEVALEMIEPDAIPTPREAFSASSPLNASGEETSAARLQPQTSPENPGHPEDRNASLEVLADQMLSLVDVLSSQERDIKALKARCQQLEEHDQAIMVAFTTFFHVLAAGQVATLKDVGAILHDIIKVAQHEAYPQQSICFLQRLATMLHQQACAGAPEVRTSVVPQSEITD